jgi:hypothetical protein
LCAAIALLFCGYLAGRSRRPAPPPLIIARQANSPLSDGPSGAAPREVTGAAAPSHESPPTLVADDVYLCGARTKKGTPCSRRVHGPVRCWQHKGMPAMLPQEKLLVKG